MSDIMDFPATVEEFMEAYKMVDKEQIYSNGTEYVPIFRMKQWFEHEKSLLSAVDIPERNVGKWIPGREIGRMMLTDTTLMIDYEDFKCSICGLALKELLFHVDGTPVYKFCPNCGAKMTEDGE